MREVILQKLKEIEKAKNIEILYAVESGSRAWGFESSDSDWDVRFIYKHKIPYYFQVHRQEDTINCIEGDLDFSGWELKKTLGLLYKSNPPLLEWLSSPLVYREDPKAIPELRTLAKGYYSVNRAIYHYLHMAENNYHSYIRHKDEVKHKKYLYILRPLLACNWLATYGTMPPMEIEKTLALVEGQFIHPYIRNLIDHKKSGKERGLILPIKEINEYIEFQLSYFNSYVKSLPPANDPDVKHLDNYLLKQIHGST